MLHHAASGCDYFRLFKLVTNTTRRQSKHLLLVEIQTLLVFVAYLILLRPSTIELFLVPGLLDHVYFEEGDAPAKFFLEMFKLGVHLP